MPGPYLPSVFNTPPRQGAGALVNQFSLDSVGSTSRVASPTAGSTITWLQVPQDGKYSVQLFWGYEAVNFSNVRPNNVRLQVGAITVMSLITLAVPSSTMVATVILTVPSEQFIGLNVITGDTGATYDGTIVATKM